MMPPLTATMAGVPRYWGENRDYDGWFQALSDAGVTAFLPYSGYQELPEPLSLGYEADFFPPCSYDDPAFRALREHHIQLVAAGSLLYPPGEMPSLEDDPLRALLACTGEGMIAAVYNTDEPAYAALHEASTGVVPEAQRIYERVKQIAPDIPVMMAHGPIPSEIEESGGAPRPITQPEIDGYLDVVKQISAHADTIGFDLYPIPPEIAQFPAPGQGITGVDYRAAFPAYLAWLRETAGDKPYFLVLQAFSFERQLAPELAQEALDAGFAPRSPTEAELRDMACLSFAGGVSQIAWWGQSFLLEEDRTFWENVLAVTRNMTTDPIRYCENPAAVNPNPVLSVTWNSQIALASGRAATKS